MRYIAHKAEDGRTQSVQEHLEGTAKLAAGFGSAFGAQEHAYRTGLLHDIGKYAPDVQRRMQDPEHVSKVNHTSAGALEACRLRDIAGMFAIAAHHGGLMDREKLLNGKLQHKPQDYSAFRQEITPKAGNLTPEWADRDPLAGSFYARMLYSCLVDADFLDTEAFMNRQPGRATTGEPMPVLLARLQAYVQGWYPPTKPINVQRCAILDDCAEAGTGARGLYTLTVPTGGGKTVSSLMFALRHAVEHGCSRVIYVIPYTSIIEQNAAKFAEILGSENVLEHHSGAAYEEDEKNKKDEKDEKDEELNAVNMRKRLATENWDAPVVVTTAVQFFESLFAARTSKCRKLHSMANSVIIFDEAQMLPLDFLRPCVYAIAELVKHYRVTAVLCTATQPALNHLIAEYLPGMPVREIMRDREALYRYFRRTTYRMEGTLTQEALLSGFLSGSQGLCIVNSRKLAQQLYDALPCRSRFHLSTWMTPADRRRVIADIRSRLAEGLPCHVVSTSLIEAGVDLDFPAVWRQEAGLDAILQAGGRCNREGKRPMEDSVVHVFRLEGDAAVSFRQQVEAFRLATEGGRAMDALDTIHFYFEALLKTKGDAIDKKEIMKRCEGYQYRTAAEAFRLIDDQDTVTLYLPTEQNTEELEALRGGWYTRGTLRKLQQDSITLRCGDASMLFNAGRLEKTQDGYAILSDPSCYDPQRGLLLRSDAGLAFMV